MARTLTVVAEISSAIARFLGRTVRGDGRRVMRGWQKGRFDYAPKQDKGRDRAIDWESAQVRPKTSKGLLSFSGQLGQPPVRYGPCDRSCRVRK
jgi:hypothetical protein